MVVVLDLTGDVLGLSEVVLDLGDWFFDGLGLMTDNVEDVLGL